MSANARGLRDWIIQRITAVYLGFYAIFLFIYFMVHPGLSYQVWQQLFTFFWFRTLTVICLGCLVLHAWVGIWTVITDYIKIPVLRMLIQVLVILALIVFLVWGVEIVWGLGV